MDPTTTAADVLRESRHAKACGLAPKVVHRNLSVAQVCAQSTLLLLLRKHPLVSTRHLWSLTYQQRSIGRR